MARDDSVCKNWVPWKAENFLLDFENIVFSRVSQLHRVKL
jgi:hypothetical protein